ncbi:hypothetical protein ACFU5O_30985 [Streptomyces sp. NPDC057445]|uniref:hypothetical protein n=1 Tax=Streptomyces sp. NPDC057445 TaxID=3346136 RepID=UPI0036C95BA7
MDADGRQDFVVRTPSGAAHLYDPDNKGAFPVRKQLATSRGSTTSASADHPGHSELPGGGRQTCRSVF